MLKFYVVRITSKYLKRHVVEGFVLEEKRSGYEHVDRSDSMWEAELEILDSV